MFLTPFHFPPRGKGFDTPSPLGEGWEGGNKNIKYLDLLGITNS
jgi:hypothetical protein